MLPYFLSASMRLCLIGPCRIEVGLNFVHNSRHTIFQYGGHFARELDGFNGFTEHLNSRCAFVLTSSDNFKTLSEFAESRGWRFKPYSTGYDFPKAMAFWGKGDDGNDDCVWPGLSFFYNENGEIHRKTRDNLAPEDLFCSIWHMFDRLKKSVNDWNLNINIDFRRRLP